MKKETKTKIRYLIFSFGREFYFPDFEHFLFVKKINAMISDSSFNNFIYDYNVKE